MSNLVWDEQQKKEVYLRILPFIVAVHSALGNSQRGTEVQFRCPLCGNIATAKRLMYNDHVHARCECGMSLHE